MPEMNTTQADAERAIFAHKATLAVDAAALLRDYCFGIRPGQSGIAWDPVYPHHRAPRRCPFCGDIYRRHAGFVDHRDRCDPKVPTRDGPAKQAVPEGDE